MEILVHLDAAPESAARAKAAQALAKALSARVHALIVAPAPMAPYGPGAGATRAAAREALEREQRQAAALKARSEHDWRLPAEVLETLADRVFVDCASRMRASGLIVCAPPMLDPSFVDDDVFEAALFASGRPVLVIPRKYAPAPLARTIAVAWKDCREAARAIHDALPLLRAARAVTLVSVKASDEDDLLIGGAALARMEESLRAQGVAVAQSRIVRAREKESAGAAIAREAAGGDLLVMGGYGHWRWAEMLFGGVTRYMLEHAPMPILMAR